MSRTDPIHRRYRSVCARIEAACAAAGRPPGSVGLLAVSKMRDADEVATLRRLGATAFGENYVDEACAKQDALKGFELPIAWHFIGPIQSNKTRRIAERFDWVQSVDRPKIAQRLAAQRPDHLGPLNVLLQVNVDDEPQKAGCHPDQVASLAESVQTHEQLVLRGIMAIPAAQASADSMRPAFARLRVCFDGLAREIRSVDTLSMGMSSDLEPAVAEGATLVRIGTALFGPRPRR